MATDTPKEWVAGHFGWTYLGITRYEFTRLALMGRIATKADPGVPIKYSFRDIEKIRTELAKGAAAAASA